MTEHLQAIVTVLSLINPAICVTIFSQIEAGRTVAAKLGDATKAAFAILVILSVAALIGAQLLNAFGISLDAFKVAGGGVLAWMGFSMIRGDQSKQPAPSGGADNTSPSLTPLILFAASPGTITGVITLSVSHARLDIPVTALVAIGVAVFITWAAIVLAARFSRRDNHGGGGLLHDTISRFMGLIVLAMGVQFALTGLQPFIHTNP